MPVTKIGLNLTKLNNITAPTFDFKNNTEDFINDIPVKANEVSQGWLGSIVLWGLWVFLFWILSQDEYQGGVHGYSKTRAAGIASGICAILGIFSVNMGYFTNYYHVAIFIAITFLLTGVIWKGMR